MERAKYDVVIVGSGIGGLVCGCLLAKRGFKILIIEKGAKVGGYCASFSVKGFHFDAFVHALGNLSEGAQFFRILHALEIYEKLEFVRYDPSDTIITPDFTLSIWNDVSKTIEELAGVFPSERLKIHDFFNTLVDTENLESVTLTRGKTFRDLLDSIFEAEKLKKILSLFILGNLGISAKEVNAFTAIKHYKQFIIDGGYYPRGGMQKLPDMLMQRYIELGGSLILSNPVIKVYVDKNHKKSVKLKRGEEISCQHVVLNCDARHAFLDLVGERYLPGRFIEKLNSWKLSKSLFITYLGFDKPIDEFIPKSLSTWMIPDYDFENFEDRNFKLEEIRWMLICPTHNKRSCMLLTHAPFMGRDYWLQNKQIFMNSMIQNLNKFFPGIKDLIAFQMCSDPTVLNTWTNNFLGSGYGWAAVPSQFMDPDFTRDVIIQGLFVCGHWSTVAQGVEGVAIVGEKVAKTILSRLDQENVFVRG